MYILVLCNVSYLYKNKRVEKSRDEGDVREVMLHECPFDKVIFPCRFNGVDRPKMYKLACSQK